MPVLFIFWNAEKAKEVLGFRGKGSVDRDKVAFPEQPLEVDQSDVEVLNRPRI